MTETTQRKTHIAYRCPACGEPVYGIAGRFALHAEMLRLKCPCGASSLDIHMEPGSKVRLSVPCIFCKQNHTYTVSQSIFFDRDRFLLSCPYAGMDIAFFGDEDKIMPEIDRTGAELEELFRNLEAEKLSDIQPQDMDDDEILPDPEVYDIVRFLVRELEADGKIDCPCHSGHYEFRLTDGGVQGYCPECGATHEFAADSVAAARDYLDTDELQLH